MKMALRLAQRGAGFVSPNPMVGAVLVKDGRIISTGYHRRYGAAHAEAQALDAAVESVKDAVLYCNLEPCCHLDKQTPPCAQRLIREGIKKVVISGLDPNPRVRGKGVKLLKAAGIEVITGLLETENSELNRFYIKYTQMHRPYVTLKIAQTIDGKIARQKGKQTWISAAGSRRMVHRLRTEFDAVLVGGNTVRTDNPELTRHGVKGQNPVRVIVDGKIRVSPGLKIFDKAQRDRIIVLAAKNPLNSSRAKKLESIGCQVILAPADRQGRINLDKILEILGAEKITSLLVEGGQQVFSQFLERDRIDELILVVAPQIWGGGLPAFQCSKDLCHQTWRLREKKNIAGDLVLIYRRS